MAPPRPYCAGIIVFDGNRTVLVCTPNGYFSFPKGKLNKGEPEINGAWRELQEETGMTDQHVKLLDGIYFDEYSAKGVLSIRYFVGTLTNKFDKFTFDKKELDSVEWHNVEIAGNLEKFKKERRDILTQAYEYYRQNANS